MVLSYTEFSGNSNTMHIKEFLNQDLFPNSETLHQQR